METNDSLNLIVSVKYFGYVGETLKDDQATDYHYVYHINVSMNN